MTRRTRSRGALAAFAARAAREAPAESADALAAGRRAERLLSISRWTATCTSVPASVGRIVSRVFFALAGAVFGALLVSIAEAHSALLTLPEYRAPSFLAMVLAEVGVLAPAAILVGLDRKSTRLNSSQLG